MPQSVQLRSQTGCARSLGLASASTARDVSTAGIRSSETPGALSEYQWPLLKARSIVSFQ